MDPIPITLQASRFCGILPTESPAKSIQVPEKPAKSVQVLDLEAFHMAMGWTTPGTHELLTGTGFRILSATIIVLRGQIQAQ